MINVLYILLVEIVYWHSENYFNVLYISLINYVHLYTRSVDENLEKPG